MHICEYAVLSLKYCSYMCVEFGFVFVLVAVGVSVHPHKDMMM